MQEKVAKLKLDMEGKLAQLTKENRALQKQIHRAGTTG